MTGLHIAAAAGAIILTLFAMTVILASFRQAFGR